MKQTKQFRKNFIWNIIGTGVNAFNSLFFMVAVTRINGIDNAGIFTIAYATACILYVIGIYAGRIYQVTEPNKDITNKEYIVNRLITVVLMNILVLAFCLIKQYDWYKTLVFLLLTCYKSLEAFSEVIYGVLQKNEKLNIVGKSLFIKAILSVGIFIIVDVFSQNVLFSIISIIFTWIIIIYFYDYKKSKNYINMKDKININYVFKIFKLGFFTFAISFLGLYIMNAPKYAIDTYLPNDLQTIFGIIVMPATIIGLVAQFLLHPFLNQILNFYEKIDLKSLKKLILKLIFIIVGVGGTSSVLAYFWGTQIIGIIYGIDLSMYKIGLLTIIIASTFYTIGVIYSSVLTTVRETFSQFIIYIVISIFAYIVSELLTKTFNIDGAIWAYFGIMSLQCIIYSIYTNIKLKTIFEEKLNEESNINSTGI